MESNSKLAIATCVAFSIRVNLFYTDRINLMLYTVSFRWMTIIQNLNLKFNMCTWVMNITIKMYTLSVYIKFTLSSVKNQKFKKIINSQIRHLKSHSITSRMSICFTKFLFLKNATSNAEVWKSAWSRGTLVWAVVCMKSNYLYTSSTKASKPVKTSIKIGVRIF